MNEKKSEDIKKEKPEMKLPQFQYVYQGNLIIYTDKGPCMWATPAAMGDLEEIIKYINLAKSKFEEQIEINQKKAEEETAKNKPPIENKNQDADSNYKSV